MKIDFCGHELILHHSGVALWPKYGMAIVSDMHLEKGSHFAMRGFFLPPYDSIETLLRLLRLCEAENIRRLIILGDCFHDARGYGRLQTAARAAFDKLMQRDPVWIKGNHDGDFVPPGIAAHDHYALDGLVFRHVAEEKAPPGEISGHFHPKIKITHRESKIFRSCFIEDGGKMILPAFGAYTGGLSVDNPAVRDLFNASPRCHVLGEKRVFSFGLDPLRVQGT